MNSIYYDLANHATANLIEVPPLHGWLLTGIEVLPSNRRKGIGSKLLRQVTDAADKENVTLYLAVSPDGSMNSLTESQLVRWYRKNGFIWHTELGLAMIRKPNPTDYITTWDKFEMGIDR